MFMHELNSDQEQVMLLIHPMMSSGMGMKECITNHMDNQVRYLLPDLAGHGDAVTQTYHSAAEEAGQIHAWLIEHAITDIQLGYCASLGGCVLFELVKYTDITFHHLFFEGVSLYENARILFFLSKKMFLGQHKKALKDPSSAVKTMEKLYGKDAAQAMAERFIAMDDESIINVCRDCSFVKLPSLDEHTQEKCVFAYGEKEFDLKNSSKILPAKYPKAELRVWQGCGHCERLSKDSAAYAAMLKQIVDRYKFVF